MEPNSREKTRCKHCGTLIFFAVTRNGKRQPLNVTPDPVHGSVAAYRRGVQLWWCRSLLAATDGEHPAHPLEKRFVPHHTTCGSRAPSAQLAIPGLDDEPPAPPPVAPPRPDNVIPFRRRRP
ncbi:hypothetical protein ABT352_23345 [Streptosporangium sp. NPDC000563]|uniref:hypothetical protein n=1 Tax=Streptosporangium sp. NPDC000563 TaxID=3154366 RepID=UPI0033206982